MHRFREIEGMLTRNKSLDFGFSALFYQLIQFPLFSAFLELGTSARSHLVL